MTFSGGPRPRPVLAAPEPLPRLLRDLIHERTGLFFDDERLDTMLEKIQPRALARGLTSMLDYYYLLKYEEEGVTEWRRVMDAFSVQETYFWREFDQVRAVVSTLVPAWFRISQKPFRIWSAACATGEEPYTLAIALQEAGFGAHPIEILASDASEAALKRAEAGVYRDRSFRALPAGLRQKYFQSEREGDRLRRDLLLPVNFRWANLVDPSSYADLGTVHVIFCRNVFIYFSSSTVGRVASYFAPRLPANGHLFIGASESLLKLTSAFDLQQIAGAFVYVRKGDV